MEIIQKIKRIYFHVDAKSVNRGLVIKALTSLNARVVFVDVLAPVIYKCIHIFTDNSDSLCKVGKAIGGDTFINAKPIYAYNIFTDSVHFMFSEDPKTLKNTEKFKNVLGLKFIKLEKRKDSFKNRGMVKDSKQHHKDKSVCEETLEKGRSQDIVNSNTQESMKVFKIIMKGKNGRWLITKELFIVKVVGMERIITKMVR